MSAAQVELIAAALEEGESTREVCPFCNGGSSGEKSLNVTVQEGLILYNCHRASCPDGRGAIGSGPRLVHTSSRPKQKKVTPYEGELEYLDAEWREYLGTKIGWLDWHMEQGRPMYAPDEHRIAYPIFSPMGLRRGWVLRSYDQFARRKALTRMDVEEPHLSYYRDRGTATLVVVEDIPSAVRAARYVDCVALCGSGCSPEYAGEMAAHYRHIVWALDADATAWSLRLMREHALLFDSSRVLTLEKDMKDEEEEVLCDILTWE